jgi:aminoglycoside phosphotransferase (APT) family kinase protein
MLQPLHDLSTIASDLQKSFPDLPAIPSLAILGEGFSSLAVETPDEIVFRIPRTPEAGARYAREFQLLPLIKPHLPVAIPEPRWYRPASVLFPYGVIGYPKLSGHPLDFDDLLNPVLQPAYAAQIATILVALHQTPTASFPLQDHWPVLYQSWQNQREVVMPVLKEVLRIDEYRRVAAWWQEFLPDDDLRAYSPVLIHGDFWFGNLLIEKNQITGLIDFENIALGDPALDFTPLLYLGENFFRQVLDSYQQQGSHPLDSGFEHRLRSLWSVREFGGLDYAIRYNDRDEFEESLLKLRKSPILSPAGLDGWGK